MADKKEKSLSMIMPPSLALVLDDDEETLVHEGWQDRLLTVLENLGRTEVTDDSLEGTGLMVKPEHIVVPYFHRLEEKLLALISVFDWVAVCTAWLTSETIISKLAEVDARVVAGVPLASYSLITQSTYLTDAYRKKIRPLQDKIRFYQPADGSLLHHKFVVFGNYEYEEEVPLAVWTGSYNLSVAAKKNLENAVFIQDVAVAQEYYAMFEQLYAAGREP